MGSSGCRRQRAGKGLMASPGRGWPGRPGVGIKPHVPGRKASKEKGGPLRESLRLRVACSGLIRKGEWRVFWNPAVGGFPILSTGNRSPAVSLYLRFMLGFIYSLHLALSLHFEMVSDSGKIGKTAQCLGIPFTHRFPKCSITSSHRPSTK